MLFVKRLNLAFQCDQQWLTTAINRFASRDFDPTFTDAIFLNIKTLFAIEADTDVVFEQVGMVVGAAWTDGKAIRQIRTGGGIVHGSALAVKKLALFWAR